MTIKYTFDDLIFDSNFAGDKPTSAQNYLEQLTTELQKDFPKAKVSVRYVEGEAEGGTLSVEPDVTELDQVKTTMAWAIRVVQAVFNRTQDWLVDN